MYLPFFWILVQSFWRNFLDLFFSSLLLTEFAMIFYTVFMLFVLCHTQYSGLPSFFPYERILEPSANCFQFHFMQCLGYLFYRSEHTKNSTIVRRVLFLGLAVKSRKFSVFSSSSSNTSRIKLSGKRGG